MVIKRQSLIVLTPETFLINYTKPVLLQLRSEIHKAQCFLRTLLLVIFKDR